jgi:hypothetical protein
MNVFVGLSTKTVLKQWQSALCAAFCRIKIRHVEFAGSRGRAMAENRNQYFYDHQKENYDKLTTIFKKGDKEKLAESAKEKNMTISQYIVYATDICENIQSSFGLVKAEVVRLLCCVCKPESKENFTADIIKAKEAVFVLKQMNLGFVSEDGMERFTKTLEKAKKLGLQFLNDGETPEYEASLAVIVNEAHEALDWEYYQPITAIIKGKDIAVRKEGDKLEKRELNADKEEYWLVGIKERTRRRTTEKIRSLLELKQKDRLVMQYTTREKSTGKYVDWFAKGV